VQSLLQPISSDIDAADWSLQNIVIGICDFETQNVDFTYILF